MEVEVEEEVESEVMKEVEEEVDMVEVMPDPALSRNCHTLHNSPM